MSPGSDAEPERCYEVIQEYTEVRAEPSLEAPIVGQVGQGLVLRGCARHVGEEPWLRLAPQELPPPIGNVTTGDSLWTPIQIMMSFMDPIDMLRQVEGAGVGEGDGGGGGAEPLAGTGDAGGLFQDELRRQEEEWARQEEEGRRREAEERAERQRREAEAEEERQRQEDALRLQREEAAAEASRLEQERRRREEEDLARKQREAEEKALQMKPAVVQASQTAERFLGKPLSYSVLSAGHTYREPLPQAEQLSALTRGLTVHGYPGSPAWVRLAGPVYSETWASVRSQQPGRELVLQAQWGQLRADDVQADTIKVSWPGVEVAAPCRAEYVIEWRPKEDPPPSKASGRAMSPSARVTLSGLPPGQEVQLRVSVRVTTAAAAAGKDGGEFKLSGPWIDFQMTSQAVGGGGGGGGGGDKAEGEGLYEVEHKFLMLRCEPSRKGRACGTLKQGMQVYAQPYSIGGEPWVKLSAQQLPPPESREIGESESCWALADATGTDLGLGVLMARIKDGGPSDGAKRLGRWKVLHTKVVIREGASTTAEPLGYERQDAIVEGTSVTIGGVNWLQRSQYRMGPGAPPREAWMLIDGAGVGLGCLLERVGDAETVSKKLHGGGNKRPMPPRPLTASWLAAHGGLATPPYSVREDLLPESEDVGMASQCSVVWVAPAGGGMEESYIAKRAVEEGDLSASLREYRFYTEVVKKVPFGEPTMLEDVMRVPRCHVAHWKDGGGDGEREHFLLFLERLDRPAWTGWDVSEGVSFEQAVAAVETLGRMHRRYENEKLLDSLDWLPRGRVDLNHLEGVQHYYGVQFQLHQSVLRELLKGKAMEAAEALCVGGSIPFVFERLAQPPLTLTHGDYRPENLRFSTGSPTSVAAFDWGLVNVSRGIDDLCYFIMLCQPPDRRRERDHELLVRYLRARGWECDSEDALHAAMQDVKCAALCILSFILMTRLQTRQAGFFQGTREMLTRMLAWTGQAIEDWHAYDVLPTWNL